MQKQIFRILKILFVVYLLYVLVSILILPLFWKTAEPGQNLDLNLDNAGAERVCCVDDNKEALLWRLRMINSAKEKIILSTFDLHNDQSGRDIMAALANAAKRGVRIQILVDDATGKANLSRNRDFLAFATSPNIEVRFYNPVSLLKPWKANYRLHDKYLIVDDSAYILGGRNTYDLFLGDYADTYNIDRDIVTFVQVPGENTSLSQLQRYFSAVWELNSNRTVIARQTKRICEARKGLMERGKALKECYQDAYRPFDWETETMPVRSIRLLSNAPEAENKKPQLWADLCSLMKQGNNIQIQTPYIVCNQMMYKDLSEICDVAGSVQIMTNAPEIGANPFGCSDYLLQKNQILQCGINMNEWLGSQSMHTKTVLVDNSITVVGSYNIDMRSTYLDTELMLVIDCPALNQKLRENFNQMAQQSRLVSSDGSEKLGAQCELPEGSAARRLRCRVLGYLLQPFRHLL